MHECKLLLKREDKKLQEHNMDISFEEQQLQDLKSDIDSELIAVRGILRQVADECNSDPAEDDTVLVGIQKIGDDMRTAWNGLCDAFDKVSHKIGDLFAGYNKTANTQRENADSMNRSL